MHRLKLIPVLISTLIILSASCKKNNVLPDQLSLLPKATQTGANTFGCLVNGQAFLPRKNSTFGGPALRANYVSALNGNSYLTIIGSYDNGNGSATSVAVYTDSLSVGNGQTLALKQYNTPGMAAGFYGLNLTSYTTTADITGQLNVTLMDEVKHIISGTFSFTAINTSGQTVKITDGRFDVLYQ